MECIHTHTHVYIYIYIHHGILAIKTNEITLFTERWIEMKIMLSEISEVQKVKYLIIIHM
jgi:hypothetical protein